MNIGFVPAKTSDAAAISALRQRIWDTTYRGIYPDTVIDDFNYDWHQQRDLKKISDPSFTVYPMIDPTETDSRSIRLKDLREMFYLGITPEKAAQCIEELKRLRA